MSDYPQTAADYEWINRHRELAGLDPIKRPKVSLDHPYRKPHGWHYVEERSIGDPTPRYIKTYRR